MSGRPTLGLPIGASVAGAGRKAPRGQHGRAKQKQCCASNVTYHSMGKVKDGEAPNDLKLSDGGGWRGSCDGGAKDSIQATEKGGSK